MTIQEQNGGKVKLNLESLVKTIAEGCKKTESLFSSARIHKVPQDLLKLSESAYIPQLIAIGPLHRDKEQLEKPLKNLKIRYTHFLVARMAKGMEDRVEKIRGVLQECATKMEERVGQAKKCYAAELTVSDHDMAEMMLFDGCFILELLYWSHCLHVKASSSSVQLHQPTNEGEECNRDPILGIILNASIIKQDLLQFENQIPFFVLEDLFNITLEKIPGDKIPGGEKLTLTEYVVSYFRDIMSPKGKVSGSVKKTTSWCSPSDCCVLQVCGSEKEIEHVKNKPGKAYQDYDHILHVLHDHYGPGNQCENKKNSSIYTKKKKNSSQVSKEFSALEVRASELDYGGVKFVSVEGNNLSDVKFREPTGICWWFHRATFEIPTLNIHDPTEPFLRNLIAFEQFRPGVPRYITAYAKLMDVLINSEKDVDVLSKANVIRNFLGTDKDVSELANKLCKEVVAGFFFEEDCQKAFEYSKRWWPRYMAYWRLTYVASPWRFIGFCLGLIAFGIQITNFIHNLLR